jgi:hypothetical protein
MILFAKENFSSSWKDSNIFVVLPRNKSCTMAHTVVQTKILYSKIKKLLLECQGEINFNSYCSLMELLDSFPP